jgi:fructoselysine 6-kinase
MRVACVGDNVVDVYTSLRLVFPGGNAVNVAVAARRAGAETAYVGALGTDEAGRIVREALVAEDVDISHTRIIEGPNAYSTIELVGGDRIFGAADIGVSRVVLDNEDLGYLAGFDIVHSGDNSMCESQISRMAEVAPISYDFGERPPEYWRPLAPYVRVACFSAGDRSAEQAEQLARAVAELGPQLVVVTEGARGAMVMEAGKVHRVGTSVTPIDTLGAGDSLIGCFLAQIIAGEDSSNALEAANAAAARTCLHHGAFGHVHAHDSGSAHEDQRSSIVFAQLDRVAHAPAPMQHGSGT